MKAIKPYYEIIDDLNGQEVLKKIELCGRVCYKSEHKIEEGSAEKFVAGIVKKNHGAVLEHFSFSVRFIVDRGISHEIVRHRLASYCQESTRYCNYGKDDFGSEITFILPHYLDYKKAGWNAWQETMNIAEKNYFKMLDEGFTAQQARAVLPNSLKTEIVMTANLREWQHFLKLRTSPAAHSQIREVTIPLLEELKTLIPVVFDEIESMGGVHERK